MSRLLPFLMMGTMIVLLVVGIIVISYLLIYGAIIGLILFAIVFVKEKLFAKPAPPTVAKRGETIDHDRLN